MENKDELRLVYERKYQLELKSQLNIVVEGRTKSEYDKEYYQQNLQRIKEYYKQNKERLANKSKEKFQCECGGRYTRSSKSGHAKTKKHLQFTLGN